MAEDVEQQDDIDAAEAGGAKSKKLLIIIAVVVLALAGGGVMMFLGGGEDTETSEAEGKKEAVETVKNPPIYYSLSSPFIVNFSQQSEGLVRYLQIKLKVMARQQSTIDAFILHEPAVQHELLMLFYGQNYDELNTTVGTKALRESALTSINEVLKTENVPDKLEAVYFTSLIMQ